MIDFTTLCAHLCVKDIHAAQLMMDGVAFYNPPEFGNKAYYVVFSHEGDLLDYLSVFDVQNIVRRVKELGGTIGKCQGVGRDRAGNIHPGFTLAWEGMHP